MKRLNWNTHLKPIQDVVMSLWLSVLYMVCIICPGLTDCVTFCVHLQIIQYQTVRYDTLPLSPISRNRLSEYMIAFMIRLLGYIFGALVWRIVEQNWIKYCKNYTVPRVVYFYVTLVRVDRLSQSQHICNVEIEVQVKPVRQVRSDCAEKKRNVINNVTTHIVHRHTTWPLSQDVSIYFRMSLTALLL